MVCTVEVTFTLNPLWLVMLRVSAELRDVAVPPRLFEDVGECAGFVPLLPARVEVGKRALEEPGVGETPVPNFAVDNEDWRELLGPVPEAEDIDPLEEGYGADEALWEIVPEPVPVPLTEEVVPPDKDNGGDDAL